MGLRGGDGPVEVRDEAGPDEARRPPPADGRAPPEERERARHPGPGAVGPAEGADARVRRASRAAEDHAAARAADSSGKGVSGRVKGQPRLL